jgi:hypothetical protein
MRLPKAEVAMYHMVSRWRLTLAGVDVQSSEVGKTKDR